MPGRTFSSSTYRYGFNGKENDNETVGSGEGTQDYGFRIYNPSLGKFLSVDPLTASFPELTTYQFASNSPIANIDLDGLESCFFMQLRVKQASKLELTTAEKITLGTQDGCREVIEETWEFFSKNMWSVDYWKNTGNSLCELTKPDHKPNPTRMAVVQGIMNIPNWDAYDWSKAGTKITVGLVSSAVGDKGLSKLGSLKFLKKFDKLDDVAKLYRVQGGVPPNASRIRFNINSEGMLTIEGNDMLYVTFDDKTRAMEFLTKRGDRAYLFEANIKKEFVDKIRKEAVNQADGAKNPGKPQKVDQNKTINSFGIPKEYFTELLNSIEN